MSLMTLDTASSSFRPPLPGLASISFRPPVPGLGEAVCTKVERLEDPACR